MNSTVSEHLFKWCMCKNSRDIASNSRAALLWKHTSPSSLLSWNGGFGFNLANACNLLIRRQLRKVDCPVIFLNCNCRLIANTCSRQMRVHPSEGVKGCPELNWMFVFMGCKSNDMAKTTKLWWNMPLGVCLMPVCPKFSIVMHKRWLHPSKGVKASTTVEESIKFILLEFNTDETAKGARASFSCADMTKSVLCTSFAKRSSNGRWICVLLFSPLIHALLDMWSWHLSFL